MKERRISGAAKVALIYFLVSVAYIYMSDSILRALVEDPNLLTIMQTYKGMVFVALTSVLIYYLVWKSERESERLIRELDEKVKERTSELEEAILLAQSTNRTKSEFLANMSHELRTPLNAIIGFSEAMLSGIYGPVSDRHREYLNDILMSGENLLALINDILDLSKIESGSLKLEPCEFSLRELIKSVVGMFREKAVRHGITLEYTVENGLDVMTADQRKLKHIIVNLLSNAFKFTPDGGSVRVTARKVRNPQAEFIEISVEDTGIGVSKEDVPRLFQVFQQLESPYQKRYAGAGLGLFLTKRLVELHGGRIWVESERERGAAFTFSIPVKGISDMLEK